jgi:hypothetical protein
VPRKLTLRLPYVLQDGGRDEPEGKASKLASVPEFHSSLQPSPAIIARRSLGKSAKAVFAESESSEAALRYGLTKSSELRLSIPNYFQKGNSEVIPR